MLSFNPVLSPSDWRVATDLRNLCWPDMPGTLEQGIEAHANSPADHKADRMLAMDGERAVAYLILQPGYWYSKPGRFEGRIFVHPDLESKAVYDTILSELTRRAFEKGGERFAVWSRSNRDFEFNYLQEAGFIVTQRNPESSLNPQSFDAGPFADLLRRLESEGYRFASLNELKPEFPDWIHRAYRFDMDVMADVPLPEPMQEIPLESFEKDLNSAFADHDGMLYSVFEGEWIGATALHPNQVDKRLRATGLTGVYRSHRRKGLALCLKSISLGMARSQGVIRVSTDNHEDNPMFQINLRLGFRKEFEWVCCERTLTDS